MRVNLIAALSREGVIGRGGQLPWRLSADLKRFKQRTMGHAVVMGRKTWESIGRVLPGRTMIVLSRQADYHPAGVQVAADLREALALAAQGGAATEVFIIGGAEVYRQALPLANRLLLTRVDASVSGDAVFPPLDWSGWQLQSQTHHEADERNEFAHTFEIYERKRDVRCVIDDV